VSLPSYVEFIEPLLRYLVAQDCEIKARDVYEAVADVLGLSSEQKAEMLPSGQQAVYQHSGPAGAAVSLRFQLPRELPELNDTAAQCSSGR